MLAGNDATSNAPSKGSDRAERGRGRGGRGGRGNKGGRGRGGRAGGADSKRKLLFCMLSTPVHTLLPPLHCETCCKEVQLLQLINWPNPPRVALPTFVVDARQ